MIALQHSVFGSSNRCPLICRSAIQCWRYTPLWQPCCQGPASGPLWPFGIRAGLQSEGTPCCHPCPASAFPPAQSGPRFEVRWVSWCQIIGWARKYAGPCQQRLLVIYVRSGRQKPYHQQLLRAKVSQNVVEHGLSRAPGHVCCIAVQQIRANLKAPSCTTCAEMHLPSNKETVASATSNTRLCPIECIGCMLWVLHTFFTTSST